MGLEVDRAEFEEDDYRRFAARLVESLQVLEELLARPDFGEGPASIGAELEVSLVDARARPLPGNRQVLADSVDPRLTYELDRFNLESNLRHGPLAGRPFRALGRECHDVLEEMQRAARGHGGRIAMIGILPTLETRDLEGAEAMTESLRYRALATSLRRLRDGPFELDIRGEDALNLACESVAFEGAATSFQVHVRVPPRDFARFYNALQLTTPVLLAVSGNSPIFLGHRLWCETRIALFKQAVDARRERGEDRRPARVSFGEDWIAAPLELFAANVEHHPPLLPVMDGEPPRSAAADGRLPRLRELRLHQGTVWRWNRAIYDPDEGGHLRVEMRSLPSGPTVTDMLANTAFHVGIAAAIAEREPDWTLEFPFESAHGDFYRAAQSGPRALLAWPEALGGTGQRQSAAELCELLLPWAQRGLDAWGVERGDSQPLLEVFGRRAGSGRTGADWQQRALARAEATRPRREAVAWMLERYLERSVAGDPVASWDDPAP